jgi:hypothetical protein
MSILKNLFANKNNDSSCCNIQIEEVKPQSTSGCCENKEGSESVFADLKSDCCGNKSS